MWEQAQLIRAQLACNWVRVVVIAKECAAVFSIPVKMLHAILPQLTLQAKMSKLHTYYLHIDIQVVTFQPIFGLNKANGIHIADALLAAIDT